MLKLVAPVLLATFLAACGTAPSSGPACPSLPLYTQEQMNGAADELDALPDGSLLANVFMPDYGKMRDGVRACRKAAEGK